MLQSSLAALSPMPGSGTSLQTVLTLSIVQASGSASAQFSSVPHWKVLFAGEHLADWQGFMEGAVETGEAAAKGLIS